MSNSALAGKEYRKQRHGFVKGGKGGPGRPKDKPNYATRMSREAIIEGLCAYGENGKGKNGMVGFVLAAIRKDIRNGVTMLGMITPKAIDAHITRAEINYTSVAELDQDLIKHGLPPSAEIFRLDFKGTRLPDSEAALVIDAVVSEDGQDN